MYEIPEIQDYRQKWLEAERDLAINWVQPPSISPSYEPFDNVDKDIESINESLSTSRKLEDYQPGATKTQVLSALKKVTRTPKQLSAKHGKQPVPTS